MDIYLDFFEKGGVYHPPKRATCAVCKKRRPQHGWWNSKGSDLLKPICKECYDLPLSKLPKGRYKHLEMDSEM